MLKTFAFSLCLSFASLSAFARVTSECGRRIPVSAHFYSQDIVRTKSGGCEVASHIAYDTAQSSMRQMCNSMGGQYRAFSEGVVCGGGEFPVKVAEGANDYIEVAGECAITGLSSCAEDAPAVFLGSIYN